MTVVRKNKHLIAFLTYTYAPLYCSFANKNRNFDTKRIKVTVLTFLCKNAVFAALLPHRGPKRKPGQVGCLVGFLPLWAFTGFLWSS